MMKLIMTATLVFGLAVSGVAFIAQAQAMARAATIVSGIADLRTADNLTEYQQVETHASRGLRKIQDSFVPIMWLGGPERPAWTDRAHRGMSKTTNRSSQQGRGSHLALRFR
jgi:hypothetical protein